MASLPGGKDLARILIQVDSHVTKQSGAMISVKSSKASLFHGTGKELPRRWLRRHATNQGEAKEKAPTREYSLGRPPQGAGLDGHRKGRSPDPPLPPEA